MAQAGWEVRVGLPGLGAAVGGGGASPTAPRGEAVARHRDAPMVRVEDAFLRSLHPGRMGEATFGLLIDPVGVHFDAAQPSAVEMLLADHPLNEAALLARARDARAFMARHHLSKFAATDPSLDLPEPGYVLVIDQTEGDASVRASGATADTFARMLSTAQTENPGKRIIIKTHPETRSGHRKGYFRDGLADPVSPTRLFAGASAVYTVSSGLGLEAIFHGHRPRVFGTPVYAGWGLTDDRAPVPRRGRALTVDQLFAACMILAPTWYDPVGDRLCEIEDVLRMLAAGARAWREDRHGWSALGMSRWKHPHLKRFLGDVTFTPKPGRRRMAWASKAGEGDVRLEDGFLRSRGLGAALTPPLSYTLDDLGIYYDPSRESRLERLIAQQLAPDECARARALIDTLVAARLTKYTTGAAPPALPAGHRILVPGQVEDDAGLLSAAGEVRTNATLLKRARQENPDAVLIYKPHPDVEGGFRPGHIAAAEADVMATNTDPHTLLAQVDAVWTMTSLLGFEALLRDIPVTTLGAPFYAGWGLTTDLGPVPARRTARPSVEALAHAALIAYPRYSDPVTGLALSPEAAVTRLSLGPVARPEGTLARLQAWRARLKRRSVGSSS